MQDFLRSVRLNNSDTSKHSGIPVRHSAQGWKNNKSGIILFWLCHKIKRTIVWLSHLMKHMTLVNFQCTINDFSESFQPIHVYKRKCITANETENSQTNTLVNNILYFVCQIRNTLTIILKKNVTHKIKECSNSILKNFFNLWFPTSFFLKILANSINISIEI